jgi:hypothetical protein
MKQLSPGKVKLIRCVVALVGGSVYTLTMWWMCWRDEQPDALAFPLAFSFLCMTALLYFMPTLVDRFGDWIAAWVERGNKAQHDKAEPKEGS